MKKYLSTIHQRSPEHKKRFALAVSSLVTLFIFTVWSLVNFGTAPGGILAKDYQVEAQKTAEVGPFTYIRNILAGSFAALINIFNNVKSEAEQVNLESEYKELRDNALDTYGRPH